MHKMETEEAERLRDEGNRAFKENRLQEALSLYEAALKLGNQRLEGVLYRNRAIVRLKLGDVVGSEQDCNAALKFDKTDAKALYRRALAREKLGRVGPAFADAKEALRLVPKDGHVIELLRRLVVANSNRQEMALSTENRVVDMTKLAFDGNADDDEHRTTAINNLLVLARESETASVLIWDNGSIVPKLMAIVDAERPDQASILAAVRILDELGKNRSRAMHLFNSMGVNHLCQLVCRRPWPDFIDASGLVLQRMFNALAGMDRVAEIKADVHLVEANKDLLSTLLTELENMLTDPVVSGPVRNTVVDLLLKNIMHMDGVGLPRGWSWQFVETRGLLQLLRLSCQIPDRCEFPVTCETRQHLEVCLTRLYDDMVFDTKRTIFKQKVEHFFSAKMAQSNRADICVQICAMLTTLLQGVFDIGINLITNNKVMAMMLQMAASYDLVHQSVAAELLVRSVSRRERANSVLSIGVPVLKKLYDSPVEHVKVRALMGLCKCASAGGDDVSLRTMQDGSTLKLAQTCRRYLLERKHSSETHRFALEGLSYLTLDADVKDWLVNDADLLQAMIRLAKEAGSLCIYATASIFVNVTNSYEKPKIDEEMVKLAQFAKHHVPETHPLDTDDHVQRRIDLLVTHGATTACVAVADTQSRTSLELLARCLLSFTVSTETRGCIVKEGGAKLLLDLTKKSTPEGRLIAAQALARLGIHLDPKLVFPGQRAYEVVRPLIDLLHLDVADQANYEALLTLTNLASNSESVRNRIVHDKAVPRIEEFWLMNDDHRLLRAAATELLLNLLHCRRFVQLTLEKSTTDRLKVWPLYSAIDDDERLALASSAGFAILTEHQGAGVRLLDELNDWPTLFAELCTKEHVEVQRRCLMALANMVEVDEKVAARIMQTELLHMLVAVTKLDVNDDKRRQVRKEAQRALDAAQKFGWIVPTDRHLYELTKGISTITE